jgi:hypothetical protein
MASPSRPVWTRRDVDKRTSLYKDLARHRAGFVDELGHEPSVAESHLLDALADVAIEQGILRARRQSGQRVDQNHVRGFTSEFRRLRQILGLNRNGASGQEPSLGDLMGGEAA